MSAAPPRDKGRAEYWALVLLISSGVIVSLIAFTLIWKLQERTQALEFEVNAVDISSSLQRNIHASLHELESIAAFYAASRKVERHEFRVFVKPFLSRHSSIQALSWTPRVLGPQRAAFEQAAKRDGFPGFQITEMNLQGQLVRAAPRAEHFPVYFIEPYKGNETALGFDLASEAARLRTLDVMRDTGKAVSSVPIRLVQETGRQKGFLIFWPVYRNDAPVDSVASRRANLEGLLSGVFRIDDLVEGALKELEPRGVDVYLLDESAPQGQRLLYFKPSRPGQASPDSNAEQGVAMLQTGVHHASTLDIAGRKWVVLSKPGPDNTGATRTWQPWAALVGVLAFTGFLAVYIIQRRRAEEEIRTLNDELELRVLERTAQLDAAGNSLQDEITERKRAEEVLLARERREHIENTIRSLLLTSPGDDMYADVLAQILEIFQSRFGFFGYLREGDGALVCPSMTRDIWEQCEVVGKSVVFPREIWGGLWGRVLVEKKALYKNEPHRVPEGHLPLFRSLGAPILNDGRLIGSIHVANRETDYREEDRELLEGLCSIIAPVLDVRLQRDRLEAERLRAEAALRESEERYRDLVEHSQVMMCTHDLQGRVLSLNRAAEQCLGYDRSVILETNVRELLAPEIRHLFEEYLEAVQRDGVARGLVVVLNSAGERRVWEYHNTLRTEGTAAPIVRGVAHDVTERKRAEEQLHEMSMALTNAMPGISRLDPEGRYVFINDAYARMLGYEPGELVGKDWTPTVHPEDRGVAQDAYLRMLREGKGEFEARAVCKDGSEFFKLVLMVKRVDSGGNLIGHHCFMKDITERKLEENVRQALYQASLEVQVPLTLDERLTHLLQTAQTVLDLDRVNILLADPEEQWLQAVASLGVEDPLEAIRVPIGPAGGLLAQAYRTQQMVVWDGQAPLPEALRLQPPYDRIEAFRSQVFAIVPLVIQGRAIGILGADRKRSRRPLDPATRELLQLFAAQAAVAIHNARLFEQVQAGRERLQTLSRQLVAVQEAERLHLARELHDEIGQTLTGIKLTLEMSMRSSPDAIRTTLGEAQRQLNDLMARVRTLSLDLRPAMLDDLGLVPALLWHFERYTAQTSVRVDFRQAGLEGRLRPELETAVYRIVQEALTNVARHAGVNEATVILRGGQDILSVQVQDQGRGFNPAAALGANTSSGLAGMSERAELLGGHLKIESAPGAGTGVTVKVPVIGRIDKRKKAR